MADVSLAVIIPAFNVEKYLPAALDSLLAQDEFPDEIILIDDGSSDKTREIADSYKFPFAYRVVSIENGGQGNARNLGVDLSSSDYVYFFDSDDILEPGFVSSIKEVIAKARRPDIIFFSGRSFNDRDYRGDRWVDYRRGFEGDFDRRVDFLEKSFASGALFCSPCLYVSKRALWGAGGLRFGANYLEDEALFFPLIFACETFSVRDRVLFLRRNREGSTMTMAPNQRHVDGALNCVRATLELHGRQGLGAGEYWHIKKRLEAHCVAYMLTARQAGSAVLVRPLLEVVIKAKSVSLTLKVVFHFFGFNRLRAVRAALDFVKGLSRRRQGE